MIKVLIKAWLTHLEITFLTSYYIVRYGLEGAKEKMDEEINQLKRKIEWNKKLIGE